MDSAQVNLALSLAMSGHGAEAVGLLRPKAIAPGASLKIKHDYAVALALSGDRAEAERVLSATLSADEAHDMLDSVTGTHTKRGRDDTRLASRERNDDAIPPDVVQVPEGTAPPTVVVHAPVKVTTPPMAAVGTAVPPVRDAALTISSRQVRPRGSSSRRPDFLLASPAILLTAPRRFPPWRRPRSLPRWRQRRRWCGLSRQIPTARR